MRISNIVINRLIESIKEFGMEIKNDISIIQTEKQVTFEITDLKTCVFIIEGIPKSTAYVVNSMNPFEEEFKVMTLDESGLIQNFKNWLSFCKEEINASFVLRRTIKSLLKINLDLSFINKFSSKFSGLYSESISAKENGFLQLSGMGFRLCVEVLIKDYVLYLEKSLKAESVYEINTNFLIKNTIIDQNIVSLSERLLWVGNDYAHIKRKHENVSLDEFVEMIELLINYINTTELLKERVLSIKKIATKISKKESKNLRKTEIEIKEKFSGS